MRIFFWILSFAEWAASACRCSFIAVESLDTYTNLTVDTDKCEILVVTSPGNRIIAVVYDTENQLVYDGNSTAGSVLIPRYYSRYIYTTVSQGNQLFIEGATFSPYLFLLSTGESSCGYNLTVVDHDIAVEVKGEKCIIFAETLTANNIVAVLRSGASKYMFCLLHEPCPVILVYDRNYIDGVTYVIPPDSSFASRGNKIAIECVHDCEEISITLYQIVSRQIVDVEVRSSGQIESPRYPLTDGEVPHNLQLIWVVTSVFRASYTLIFLKFDLTVSPQKCLDILKIESSNGFTKDLCGDFAMQLQYHLTSNEINMTFTKNSDFPSVGFILRYKACVTKLNGVRGLIIVPAHNGSARCVYKIKVDRGNVIKLTLSGNAKYKFRDGNCSGRINIYDGAPPTQLHMLSCLSDRPVKVESTSNVLYITYFGQSDPERSTTVARYSYRSAYRKHFSGEAGLIILPKSKANTTIEYHFIISVSKMKKIRLFFHRQHNRIDNETCANSMNVTDGQTSSSILYSGCVFSTLPVFVETTSNTMTIIVFLNDKLNFSRPLGFYIVYEEKTVLKTGIIIAGIGLVILFLTGNILFWIRKTKKKNITGRPTIRQRDIVIDNITVYNIQEEITENPYDEVE